MRFTATFVLFLLAAVLPVPSCAQVPRKQTERKSSVEIEIALPKDQFLVTEEVLLKVRLHNTGSAPLEVPDLSAYGNEQPVYHLSGPALSKPLAATMARAGAGPLTVSLAPGATTEDDVPLSHIASIKAPGAYTLEASFDWKGISARSKAIRFTLSEAGFQFFSPATRAHGQPAFPVSVVAFGAPGLYLANFKEVRPDLGEINLSSFTYYAPFDTAATDWFTTVAVEAGLASPRYGWLKGRRLSVTGWQMPVQPLDLTFDARVVKPSLMQSNGDLDLLLLDTPGAHLSMARFAYATPTQPGHLVWTVALPAPAQSARATSSPSGARFAAFLTRHNHSTVITVAQADDKGATFRSATVDGLVPLNSVEPAIHVSESGAVRVACLLASPDSPREVTPVELKWTGDAEPKVGRPGPLQLPADVKSAALAYSVAGSGDPQLAWIILLADGTTLNHHSPATPRTPDGRIVTPVQVVQMSSAAYYLTVDGQNRPQLRPLH